MAKRREGTMIRVDTPVHRGLIVFAAMLTQITGERTSLATAIRVALLTARKHDSEAIEIAYQIQRSTTPEEGKAGT